MDKKKLLLVGGIVATVIIGLLLIVTLLFGGGGEPDEATPGTVDGGSGDRGEGGDAGPLVTLEYWGLWEPDGVMQPIIDEYEDANPNVQIVYTQSSFNQYEDTVFTRLEQGSTADKPAPDIFRINNTWLNKFQQHLAPLPESIMSSSEYSETFYPTAVKDFGGTDGNLYAIPLEIDGLALFYNKELFAEAGLSEPPGSWDDLIDAAKKLTIKDENGNITRAGLAMGSSANVEHSADILSLLMLQNDVEINQNYNTEVLISNERAIDALEYYSSFVTVHEVWDPNQRSDLELFFSGQLAMMFAPSWRAFDIINSNPEIEFGIAKTPNLPERTLYYSMYWGEAVSGTSSNQTEAWKFLKYLSESEQQKAFYDNAISVSGRAFGEPYSRVDLGSELEGHAYVGPFVEMAPNMVAWKMGEQSFIEEQFRAAITDVTVNGESAKNVLENTEKTINAELSKIFQQP